MNAEDVRALFPITETRAYLFSGGVAPASALSVKAAQAHLGYLTDDAQDLYMHNEDDLIAVRRLFAELMGADEEEVAITEGTSAGSNIAVDLIEPLPGSNVVIDEFVYPSSLYPWLLPPRDGLERRFVRARDGVIHLEDVERMVDDRTIAISITHVTPFEGFRHDVTELARIAHAHDAVLIVDGAQSAGAMDIDLHKTNVDFFSCCAMKWLLGSAGVGFLYIARRHLDRVPSRAGYVGGGFEIQNFSLVPTARRFELGMPNLIGLAYTRPGLEILLETGTRQVEEHVLELAGYCISGMKEHGINVITPEEPERRLGVIASYVENAQELVDFLRGRGVDTFAASIPTWYKSEGGRGDLFRVDPHVFNNREDVDRLLDGLGSYRR